MTSPACVGPTSSWQRSGPDRPSPSICGAPLDNNAYEPLAGGFIWHSGAPVPARPIWTKRKWPFLSLGLDIDMVLQQDPIDWTAWSEASDYVV